MITNFSTYINESKKEASIDNRYGFFTFLQILDDMKFSFIKSGDYLNVGNFLYFFRTEWIKNPQIVLQKFESIESIKNIFKVYSKINHEKLAFYFGVRNGILEYGFYNDIKDTIYKTGEFKVRDGEMKKMTSFKCLTMISGILRLSSTKTLIILHQVKKDMKYLFEDKVSKGTTILTTQRLRKIIAKNLLDMKDDNLVKHFVDWCNKYPWGKKVEAYIDDSTEDVSFYVKIIDKPLTL